MRNCVRKFKILSIFCVVNLCLINNSIAMRKATVATVSVGAYATNGALAGSVFGPIGAGIGAGVGAIGGIFVAGEAIDGIEESDQMENERLRLQQQENRGEYVSLDRIGRAMNSKSEYGRVQVYANEHRDFLNFENGNGPLVIARSSFSNRQSQELENIKNSINQKLLLLRQKVGSPVNGFTGENAQLNARNLDWQNAINNPSIESITRCKSTFDNAELNGLFEDIEKMFVVGKLFWKQSDESKEMLKAVAAHIRWATLTSYALPLMEQIDNERQLKQNALIEKANVQEQNNNLERSLQVRTQERDRALEELNRAQNEMEGKEAVLPIIQRNVRGLEEENAKMREELLVRRAQSPQRRLQLEENEAEISKLKKDLQSAREAFASCTLTK